MILSFNLLTQKFSTAIRISKTSTMNASKCYFRFVKAEEKIDVSFLLKIKDAVRQFNFRRKPTEDIKTLCNRMEINVQKVMAKKIRKKEKTKIDDKIKIAVLDVNNQEMSDEYSCMDLFATKGPLKVQICDQFYDAVFNAPWIMNMNLPKCLLVGFPVYPELFETLYTIKDKSDFKWYKGKPVNNQGNVISDIHIDWIPVGNSYSYVPTSLDVGMKLKLECTPGNNDSVGPAVETISTTVVEAGPGPCPFETRHKFTSSKLKGASFRCVSYNILADLYCALEFTKTVLHPYCPPYALEMDYRKHFIVKELEGYNADIYCLQEVDKKIFKNTLEPLLETIDLKGLFYKKGKTVSEGLACFFRQSRFEMLEDNKILFAEAIKTLPCVQSIWNKIKDNKPLTDRLLDRHTVASATVLQSKDNIDEIVIVGNTHLYFHPDSDHIRLLQGGTLIYWLSDLRENITKKYPGKRISLILCGDFNSVPSCGVYQLYTTGTVPDTLPDWQSNADEKVSNLCLTQDFVLESACGTPLFTNFTAGFADCLDYIFYDKNNIEVEQVIPFPSIEELKAHTALPSIVFPSDHIAIISDLRFKK